MELQQLMYFKVAAECENLSRASEKLYISQPALTRVIQRLEADLEVELFARQGKSIHLNEYGKIVLSYTDEILDNIQKMHQALQGKKAGYGGLRLVTNLPNIIRYVLPNCLRENEGMRVEGQYLESIESAEALLKMGLCDVVISDREEKRAGVTSMALMQDRVYISVPEGHPLAKKGWADYRDLDELQILTVESSKMTRSVQIILDILGRHHVQPAYISTMDGGARDYLLSTSDYCSFYSAMTSLFWKIPRHCNIPLRAPDAKIDYYLHYRSEDAERCKALIRWFKNWCRWAEQMVISEYT